MSVNDSFHTVVKPVSPKRTKRVAIDVDVSCDHNQDLVKVAWYSKKRYPYHDPYYPCCGVREGRATCLRSLWPDPAATHPGQLHIGGSRRAGGGNPQFERNHIPRGATPAWTCCGRTATAPGCRSGLRKVEMAVIEQWLKQHAKIVAAEMSVTVDLGGRATCDGRGKLPECAGSMFDDEYIL